MDPLAKVTDEAPHLRRGATSELFAQHQNPFLGTAFRILRLREDSEDAVRAIARLPARLYREQQL